MSQLEIASIAFNIPWCIEEQIRLFTKYISDDYSLIVYDNSDDPDAALAIQEICYISGTKYVRTSPPERMHHFALQQAAQDFAQTNAPYFGFVDHDIYPTCKTHLVPLISKAGFLTVGQRHAPTAHSYAWPGFFFIERHWLNGRSLDFSGIRGVHPRDDGDTGSMNWPLFAEEDWRHLHQLKHGYQPIREPDGYGLQSFAVEIIGDFTHLSNASKWLEVPEPDERERLLKELVAAL